MIDITPATDGDSEVNVDDDVKLEFTVDAQITDLTELTLEIRPVGKTSHTHTGSEFTEVDNGDGTFTYTYVYTVESQMVFGHFKLVSSTASNAKDSWKISAEE